MIKWRITGETHTRSPVVAGRFYPADPEELRAHIKRLLESVPSGEGVAPKAIIVPHAGYLYSGPIAASAYACLVPGRDIIKRVIILGPAHFAPVAGLAAPSSEAFATPLGRIPVDVKALGSLLAFRQVIVSDEAHAQEHSIEVQLPYLQMVLKDFAIVPLAVGEATPAEIEEVLEEGWGGPETCIVVSSDLSHFQNSDTARRMDRATADAVEKLEPSYINENQACGRISIRGLLSVARHRGLCARTLDLRNSGDTAGPRDRVVGYGAFVFEPAQGQDGLRTQ